MSPKKEKLVIPPEKQALYEKVVTTIPGMELKTNFGFPYTAINGNMYTLLSKSGYVGIRLGKEERLAFLEKFDSSIYQPIPGPLLKEYVTVPDDLLEDTEALKPYLEMSLAYASNLKPKVKK